MPSPGTVYGLFTRHTFNGKKRPMVCPLNEPQLTFAQRRKSKRLSEEALALASEHRKFGAAGAVAIWPKIRGQLPFWG
jgi:hypothetical protein